MVQVGVQSKSMASELRKRIREIKKGYREWDKQRRIAEAYGPHHVQEIDAIFSRELSRLEKK